ncbi:MAG: energy-dependent translational throttle protein EttA [Gemmatimonadetes bacterium]|nr:energy-dependent translational throttle protein EttA [Gemmatimonadota bacterium]
MAPQFIYVMKALQGGPPSRIILDDIWLSFYPGAKIGVLGPNGAGKSSLLKIMAGVDQDFQGEAWAHKGTRIGYLPQEPQLDESLTVQGNVELAVKAQRNLLNRFNEISMAFAEPMSDEAMNKLIEEQGKVQEQIDAHDLWNLDNKIEVAMDALRLPPADASVKNLSGGEKRRVALCRVLLEQPDMFLLDEPTNHLDAEWVAWLEHFLADFPGTVVAITHDRYFLDNVAQWILELDRGKGMPFEGNYSGWLDQKKTRLQQEEKVASEWVRMAPRARQAKSKARLQNYEQMVGEEQAEKIVANEIIIPPAPRLGNDVVIAKKLTKGFGDRLLIDKLDFSLPRGIVGVIGPNGAGKSTLFRMITGQEKPDSGELKVGETVQLAYVDQSRTLDPNKTAWEEISGGNEQIMVGKKEMNTRAYLSTFNFKGTDQQKKVGVMSGGERNRLHLAKTVLSGGNLLLLDEPTNDLDVDTLRALEEALVDYSGCAVVISHDRWFLDRLATHILAFEGDSEVVWFEGNYGQYIEDLRRRKGADADQPHRVQYRSWCGSSEGGARRRKTIRPAGAAPGARGFSLSSSPSSVFPSSLFSGVKQTTATVYWRVMQHAARYRSIPQTFGSRGAGASRPRAGRRVSRGRIWISARRCAPCWAPAATPRGHRGAPGRRGRRARW